MNVRESKRRGSSKFSSAKRFKDQLLDLKKQNLLRSPVCISSSENSRITIDRKRYIDFSSNDYLDLSTHPGIIKAASDALKKYGFGSGASRLLSGTYAPHTELEERISSFKNTESALVFNTGYAANTGIIPILAGRGDIIYSDELNHASIVDGTRLSRAEIRIYKHRDVEHLQTLLKKDSRTKDAHKLIITDSVFSMDGDIAPLDEIAVLSKKHNATIMIDDAHGTGVLGNTGRGALEHFNIKDIDLIQMGTMSKALGCFGSFVAGRRDLIDLLMSRARSFMYSTSLPPSVAAAGMKAFEIVDRGSVGRRRRLWKNRERLCEGLKALGFDTLDSETPIIPVLIGGVEETMKLSGYLFEQGMFAPAIRPPTVPEGSCRLRMSVTAAHSYDDIDRLLEYIERFEAI